jgi:DNA-binding GntR family transcriptional regulator
MAESIPDRTAAGDGVAPGRRPAARRGDSLRNQIYLDLRNRIQTGLIGPDDRLVDTEVAAEQGVSRMPVREALLQLANEGYLSGTTRGFVLPRLEPQDVADIFEIRRLLEPRAAANAARDMTPAAIALLQDALGEAEAAVKTDDARRLALANAAFRHTWIAALTNVRLAETLGRFADQVQVVRSRTLHDHESQRVVLRGLARLADAFARRDPLAAYDRMTAFIADAEEHFVAAIGRSR